MNRWTNIIRRKEGALVERYNLFQEDNLVTSPSPSVNWLFGKKSYGLPFGYTLLAWGQPKGGKSVMMRAMVGKMQQRFLDYHAVIFDTEYRDEGQLGEEEARNYGIDLDRYHVFQCNKPEDIFDYFHGDMADLLKKGCPIKFVGMDSVNGIQGRREAGGGSKKGGKQAGINTFNIGDFAQTMGIGLKSILDTQRTNRIALYMSAQERAEMDQWEQKRGNKTKAAVAFAVKHHAEYFMNLERIATADGKQDALENPFEDDGRRGMDDKADQSGHRIRVWMQDSSFGTKNRVGEFTVDYNRGIVNQHEEVFKLGYNWGVITREGNAKYVLNGTTYNGKPATMAALAADTNLQAYVMKQMRALEGTRSDKVMTDDEAEKAFETAGLED